MENILPGKGLDEIKFGMSKKDVQEILGAPDEKEEYSFSEEGDDLSESWHYDELELSASFDKNEEWTLTSLAVSSNKYLLNNKEIIGLDAEELEEILIKFGYDDLETEDWSNEEEPDYELISSEKAAMNFWLTDGIVTDVEWGPFETE